jgi:hypothetical protein
MHPGDTPRALCPVSVGIPLVAAENLFRADGDIETMRAIAYDAAVPSLRERPLSPGLRDVLERMLARAPDQRYPDGAAARDALHAFAAHDDEVRAWVRAARAARAARS